MSPIAQEPSRPTRARPPRARRVSRRFTLPAPLLIVLAQHRIHDPDIPEFERLPERARRVLRCFTGQAPQQDPASLLPICRARLAEKTRQSLPTVDRAIDDLVQARLITRLAQRHQKAVALTRLTGLALRLLGLSEVIGVSVSLVPPTESPKKPARRPVDKSTGFKTIPAGTEPLRAVLSDAAINRLVGETGRAIAKKRCAGWLQDIIGQALPAIVNAPDPYRYTHGLIWHGKDWRGPEHMTDEWRQALEREAAAAGKAAPAPAATPMPASVVAAPPEAPQLTRAQMAEQAQKARERFGRPRSRDAMTKPGRKDTRPGYTDATQHPQEVHAAPTH